jgi:hypothetical protein
MLLNAQAVDKMGRRPPGPVEPKPVQHINLEKQPESSRREAAELEVGWEPAKNLVEELESMEVQLEAFKKEAKKLALLDVDEKTYDRQLMLSADKLASAVEGLDENSRTQIILNIYQYLKDAASVIRKEIKPPAPPTRKPEPKTSTPLGREQEMAKLTKSMPSEKLIQHTYDKPETQPTQSVIEHPATTPQLKPSIQSDDQTNAIKPYPQHSTKVATIEYQKFIEHGPEPWIVYLFDFTRSALPPIIITGQMKIRDKVVSIEDIDGPVAPYVVVVATRTNYPGNYKDPVRPHEDDPYVKRLLLILRLDIGNSFVITKEMYQMEKVRKELDRRGFVPCYITLDLEASRKALEKIVRPECAARLAKVGALLPWFPEELGKNGLDGVRRRLHEMLGEKDGEQVYQIIEIVLKGGDKFPNRSLAVSLGVLDDEQSSRRRRSVKLREKSRKKKDNNNSN